MTQACRRLRKVILAGLVCAMLPAAQASAQVPARIRALALMEPEAVSLHIRPKLSGQRIPISVRKTSKSYSDLKPGHYVLELSYRETVLLEEEIVLASGGVYSLVFTGLLSDGIETNQKTIGFRLKKFLGGIEAKDANGNLPQAFVLRDNYDGSKSSAYLRFVHGAAGRQPLKLFDNDKKGVGPVAYTHVSDVQKIQAGFHRFSIKCGEVTVATLNQELENGYLYTILAGTGDATRQWDAIVLENRTKAMKSREGP